MSLSLLLVQRPFWVKNRPENSCKKSKSGSRASSRFSGGRNRRFLFKCARWSELDALILLQTLIQVAHGSQNAQRSPYGSLGIIVMGLRIAKVDQQTIPKELGDVP